MLNYIPTGMYHLLTKYLQIHSIFMKLLLNRLNYVEIAPISNVYISGTKVQVVWSFFLKKKTGADDQKKSLQS